MGYILDNGKSLKEFIKRVQIGKAKICFDKYLHDLFFRQKNTLRKDESTGVVFYVEQFIDDFEWVYWKEEVKPFNIFFELVGARRMKRIHHKNAIQILNLVYTVHVQFHPCHGFLVLLNLFF
jgi:hypothetical protein